jgi:hypothetical protein
MPPPPSQNQHHPSRASRLTTQDDSSLLIRLVCISLNYYQHQSSVAVQQINRASTGSSYYLTSLVQAYTGNSSSGNGAGPDAIYLSLIFKSML